METFQERVLARHLPAAARDCLASARVGIAGAGGLGANCALFLARSGVGHLTVVDPDVVEPSNLNRQPYFPRHVGRPKVEALAELLREVNPDISLDMQVCPVAPERACSLFADCSVLVEAVDGAATKKMLLERWLTAGCRVVSASGMGGWGGPAMSRRDLGRLTLVGDFTSEVGPSCPALAPRVAQAAALEADAVLCALLGEMCLSN